MIAVNLNSRIINEKSAPDLVAQWESYQFGADIFKARQPVTDCHNAEQRRGWWDTLRAAAEASTPGYAQKVGW